MLVEDGLPATGLWVLITGSMDLVHEGAAIQVLEPGECFGHPSLLTGMAPGVQRPGPRAIHQRPVERRCRARSAGFPVALGFRGQLATERQGDGAGRLDIKRGAIIPLVNLVRFHALANGVSISPTLDRLQAAASAGGLEPDLKEALLEAFELITRLRFEHHAELISAGMPADNLIDPGALAPIARTELREALLVVRRAQKRIVA